MSKYKLTYFDGRGRAELIRYVFAAAGVEYEDYRVDLGKWPELKPSTPLGQLPILEVDGVTLCQSHSIARFLARRFQLAGCTDIEQARADMIVNTIEDTAKPALKYVFEKDPDRKEAAKQAFVKETLSNALDNLEQLLIENNGGDGFLVGDALTWADLGFLVIVDWLSSGGVDDHVNRRPKLHALRLRLENLPRIAEWHSKRPKNIV